MAKETAGKIFELLQKSWNVPGLINYSINEEIRELLLSSLADENTMHELSRVGHPESGNTLLKQAIVVGNTVAVKLVLKYVIQKETKQIHKYLQNGTAAIAQNADIPVALKSFIAEQRAKHFIIQLVNTYEKKYERMLRKADGNRVPDRENGITSGLKDGINFVSRLAPVSWVGELVRCGAHRAIVSERINRARSLRAAHHVYFGDQEMSNKLPKRLKELLILDGFEIFCCFEEQLVNMISYQEWKKESYDLVVECCDRIKNYIGDTYREEDEELMITQGYFSKCFLKGYVKGFRSGKWGKWISNAGVKVKRSDSECRYYVKCDDTSSPEHWGFRQIFQFEKKEFGFDEKYKLMVHVNSPQLNCGVLSNSRVHDKVIQNLKFLHGVIAQNEVEEDDDENERLGCEIPDTDGDDNPIIYNVQGHVSPFIGREEQCRNLMEWFSLSNKPDISNTSSSVMVVTGSCGVGKTELVRKFASELDKDKLNIVFLDGRDLEQSFYQFYKSISSCSHDFHEEIPIEHVVRICYRILTRRLTLLVLMNVGSLEGIGRFVCDNKRFRNVKVLITSKMVSHDWSIRTSVNVLALKAFSEEECERLLSDLWVGKAPIIGTLSRILDFTPLALQQVKEYIRQVQSEELNDMNHGQIATKIVIELVESFYGNKSEYTCVLRNVFEFEVGQDKKSIVTSWQAVFDNITQINEGGKLAEEIITALAYMEPMPVGLKKLFTKSHYEGNLNRAIELLHKYKIIFPETDTNDQWKMRKIVKKIVRFQHARNNESEERLDQVIRLMWKWMSRSSEIGSDFPLDLIKHIQFTWSYAVHYSKLVEKYILNFDYSRGPVNSFLHVLLRNDRYDCVDQLLDQLASFDGNVKFSERINLIVHSKMMANGRTPLHLSVQIVNTVVRLKAVKLFIKWGSLVAVTDSKNSTPLHLAAQMGHTDVVTLLLESDQMSSDLIGKLDDSLKSALDLARDNGHDEIVGVIRDYQNDSRKSFKDVVEAAMEVLGNNGMHRSAKNLNVRNI